MAKTRQGKSFTDEMAATMREIVKEEINAALDIKLLSVNTCLDEMKSKLESCVVKVADFDQAIVDADMRISGLERGQNEMLEENKRLRLKMEQLEIHSRKFNIKIFGLPNGIEAGNPTAYTTKMLFEMFGEETIGPAPLVCVAHRIGPVKKTPRCMIARLYSLEVKQKIVRKAAESRAINYRGKMISIFPDVPPEILKQRSEFRELRSELQKLNIRSGFIHPASSTLILTFQDVTHKFSTVESAQNFFDSHINAVDSDEKNSTQNEEEEEGEKEREEEGDPQSTG